MAVKFLSQEWAQALNDALGSSQPFKNAAAGHKGRFQQIVTDTPDGGDVKYYLTLEDGTGNVGLGELTDPEATITQKYDTAVAITKGSLSAQTAFMTGKVKVTGNMMKLMQLVGVLSALGDVIKNIDTEY